MDYLDYLMLEDVDMDGPGVLCGDQGAAAVTEVWVSEGLCDVKVDSQTSSSRLNHLKLEEKQDVQGSSNENADLSVLQDTDVLGNLPRSQFQTFSGSPEIIEKVKANWNNEDSDESLRVVDCDQSKVEDTDGGVSKANESLVIEQTFEHVTESSKTSRQVLLSSKDHAAASAERSPDSSGDRLEIEQPSDTASSAEEANGFPAPAPSRPSGAKSAALAPSRPSGAQSAAPAPNRPSGAQSAASAPSRLRGAPSAVADQGKSRVNDEWIIQEIAEKERLLIQSLSGACEESDVCVISSTVSKSISHNTESSNVIPRLKFEKSYVPHEVPKKIDKSYHNGVINKTNWGSVIKPKQLQLNLQDKACVAGEKILNLLEENGLIENPMKQNKEPAPAPSRTVVTTPAQILHQRKLLPGPTRQTPSREGKEAQPVEAAPDSLEPEYGQKRRAHHFSCAECAFTTWSRYHIKQHIDVVHRKIRNFQCSECGKTFGQKGHLQKHFAVVHEGAKNFVCSKCGRGFGRKATLQHHYNAVHIGLKRFRCEQCDKRFGKKICLQRHVAIVHEGQRNHSCDFCHKSFGRKDYLEKHIVKMHKFRAI